MIILGLDFKRVLPWCFIRGITGHSGLKPFEAAVLDGREWFFEFFTKIMVPQIWGTIAVVGTTITIWLKGIRHIIFA